MDMLGRELHFNSESTEGNLLTACCVAWPLYLLTAKLFDLPSPIIASADLLSNIRQQVSIKEVAGGYVDLYCTKGNPDSEGAICSPRYEFMVNGCPCDGEVTLNSKQHVLISVDAMEHLHTYTLYARYGCSAFHRQNVAVPSA